MATILFWKQWRQSWLFAVADECGYACEIQYYRDCFCLKAMETVMVRVRGIRWRTASGHYVAEIVVVVQFFLLDFFMN